MTLDTGATISVGNPEHYPECPVRPSDGSRRGVFYSVLAGEKIKNLGRLAVNKDTDIGESVGVTLACREDQEHLAGRF